MRIPVAVALPLTLMITAVQPAAAMKVKPANISWGKAGVAFDQYRADALACANRAYGVEIGMKPQTASLLMRVNGAQLAGYMSGLQVDGVREYLLAVTPNRVIYQNSTYTETYRNALRVDVIEQLQVIVDDCLIEQGYAKFRLTRDQMRTRRQFAPGSAERQLYLHRLGSDAQVLASQTI